MCWPDKAHSGSRGCLYFSIHFDAVSWGVGGKTIAYCHICVNNAGIPYGLLLVMQLCLGSSSVYLSRAASCCIVSVMSRREGGARCLSVCR